MGTTSWSKLRRDIQTTLNQNQRNSRAMFNLKSPYLWWLKKTAFWHQPETNVTSNNWKTGLDFEEMCPLAELQRIGWGTFAGWPLQPKTETFCCVLAVCWHKNGVFWDWNGRCLKRRRAVALTYINTTALSIVLEAVSPFSEMKKRLCSSSRKWTFICVHEIWSYYVWFAPV